MKALHVELVNGDIQKFLGKTFLCEARITAAGGLEIIQQWHTGICGGLNVIAAFAPGFWRYWEYVRE